MFANPRLSDDGQRIIVELDIEAAEAILGAASVGVVTLQHPIALGLVGLDPSTKETVKHASMLLFFVHGAPHEENEAAMNDASAEVAEILDMLGDTLLQTDPSKALSDRMEKSDQNLKRRLRGDAQS